MRGVRGLLLLALLAALALVVMGFSGNASAQTEPPALGDGDWTVRDITVIRDWDVIMLRGDLKVTDGGELRLINSTLLFVNSKAGEHGITVDNGGTLRILQGATVGSSRPSVPFTFVVEAGCTLEIRDSHIEEVGQPAYGLRPDWRRIALYVGTADTLIENTSFTGGLAGPYFPDGVLPPPVRNCTFENVYGIISYGVGIEDCTFRSQSLFGVVFHGGDTGYVARCTFESVFATCVQIGYEYFEPHELHTAEARVMDCTFTRSTRAIKVLDRSVSLISNCDINGMEREGIVAGEGAHVLILDGTVNNTFDAIYSSFGSQVDWTVTSFASVRGGSITLTGNITIREDARLELVDFRYIIMLSSTVTPLSFDLHEGAEMWIVRGSVEIPAPSIAPGTWVPIQLGPDPLDVRGSLYLEEVHQLDIEDGYHIRSLSAINSTVPLGKVWVEDLYLQDSVLSPDPGGSEPQLTLGRVDGGADCWFIDCQLEGIDRIPADGAWLIVLTCDVRSYDFLYDLQEMMDEGAIAASGSPAGPPRINVWWSGRAQVHWQNQLPIAGVEVEVATDLGTSYRSMTDDRGLTGVMNILVESWSGLDGLQTHLPMTFMVNVSGLVQRDTVTFVDSPIMIDLVVEDLRPPRLVVDQGYDVATNGTNLTLSGHIGDDHSGVAFLEVAILPADYIRVPVDAGTGRFEHTVVLRNGYQSISFRGYDTVGNRGSRLVEVYYSVAAPYVFIDEPLEGDWVRANLTFIVGMTEVDAMVEVQGRTTTADNGSFRILAYLVEGPNLIMVNVTSRAGNHNSTQVLVYLDTIIPDLEVLDPSITPHHIRSSTYRIRGKAEAGAKVFINQVPIETEDDGSFTTLNINLDEGSTMVIVRAIDGAGNEASIDVVFVVDSVAPSLIALVNGEDAMKYTGDGLLMTSADSVLLTIITDEETILKVNGEIVTLEGTEVTIVHPLKEGAQTIRVRVEDLAGNGLDLDPINVDVDWSPPTLSLDASMPGMTEEALLTLRGTTEANCTLYVNGARVSVDSAGLFIKNFLLNEGDNVLVVVSTDLHGQSTSLVYEVQMTPPRPEPWPDPDSMLPTMLAITIAIIVVEVVALQLWWRRKRGQEQGKA